MPGHHNPNYKKADSIVDFGYSLAEAVEQDRLTLLRTFHKISLYLKQERDNLGRNHFFAYIEVHCST